MKTGNLNSNFRVGVAEQATGMMLIEYYNKISLKVGYSPSVNKAFVYISVFKILNFIRQLFIFSCFYSIINDQDTTIRLCNLIKVFISWQDTPMCACADRTV
jgi:hypothetical protein